MAADRAANLQQQTFQRYRYVLGVFFPNMRFFSQLSVPNNSSKLPAISLSFVFSQNLDPKQE